MHGLGELEAAVMDVLWSTQQPARVRDVLDQLATRRTLAYTTVMTVLDNLHRKGWVVRQLDGKAYLYRPARGRAEAAAQDLRQVLDDTGAPETVLLHFARTASERELAVLREAVDERRAEQ